jgi:hypothetical protein
MKFSRDSWLSIFAAFTAVAPAAAVDDTSILIKETARQNNQSLLWGAYRPNLYFGVRPRIPKSFMGGLMWAKVESYQDVQNSRSTPPFPHLGNYFEQLGDRKCFGRY